MKKIYRKLAVVIMLCLAFGVVACDSDIDSVQDAYTIHVVDEDDNPIEGVTVQFCTGDFCKMVVTDDNGEVSFDDPEGEYEIHILKSPEGYKEDSTLYVTEDHYSDMTITLEKE